MILATLLMASSMGGHCMSPSPMHAEHWLSGEYLVKQVVIDAQDEMMARLKGRPFKRIDLPLAKSASGTNDLSPGRYYYLAKATYVGGKAKSNSIPRGISLSVDVSTRGLAYVTSYRLTSEHGSSELAVVLISQTPLKGVVPVCGAAE